ncbi:hypothetical protein ACFWNH_29510 [Rhodococcus qingshengii]|uniref:hypothetical protein n=1 Tax=Rhodococcus qingshengii TaxID=334542 RepID=UPI003665835B
MPPHLVDPVMLSRQGAIILERRNLPPVPLRAQRAKTTLKVLVRIRLTVPANGLS